MNLLEEKGRGNYFSQSVPSKGEERSLEGKRGENRMLVYEMFSGLGRKKKRRKIKEE